MKLILSISTARENVWGITISFKILYSLYSRKRIPRMAWWTINELPWDNENDFFLFSETFKKYFFYSRWLLLAVDLEIPILNRFLWKFFFAFADRPKKYFFGFKFQDVKSFKVCIELLIRVSRLLGLLGSEASEAKNENWSCCSKIYPRNETLDGRERGVGEREIEREGEKARVCIEEF